MYNDVLNAVCVLAQAATTLPVIKGGLPQQESVSIAIASGSSVTEFGRHTVEQLVMAVNSESKSLATAQKALDAIHMHLTRCSAYPETAQYQIYSIETASAPGYLDRQANGQYLCGSSILVKVYNKRG